MRRRRQVVVLDNVVQVVPAEESGESVLRALHQLELPAPDVGEELGGFLRAQEVVDRHRAAVRVRRSRRQHEMHRIMRLLVDLDIDPVRELRRQNTPSNVVWYDKKVRRLRDGRGSPQVRCAILPAIVRGRGSVSRARAARARFHCFRAVSDGFLWRAGLSRAGGQDARRRAGSSARPVPAGAGARCGVAVGRRRGAGPAGGRCPLLGLRVPPRSRPGAHRRVRGRRSRRPVDRPSSRCR